jgi:hypothetical protein
LDSPSLHAFLSQGDPGKMGLEKAYELVEYLGAA